MKFPSFVRLFGKRWLRNTTSGKRGKARRPSPASVSKPGIELLEDRTLMSVLPPPTYVGHFDISNARGHESNPSIAVDPTNPDRVVAVYTRNDANFAAPTPQIFTEGRFSVNGGRTWTAIATGLGQAPFLINPASTATPPEFFQRETDASVAFDRNGNFYVVSSQSTNDLAAGVILLRKYSFAGGSPIAVDLDSSLAGTQRIVYQWTGGVDQVFNPTLAVDDTLPSYTDPDTGATLTNPGAGNVYIAWSTNLTAPQGAQVFNPNRIQLIASSNGGFGFGAVETVSDAQSNPFRYAYPRLTVSQGTLDGSVAPGQVTVVFDDFLSQSTANPPQDVIWSDRLTGGGAVGFTGTGGPVADAINPGMGNHIPVATAFPITVNVTNPGFVTVSDVDVTVNLTHGALAELLIQLVPPMGSGLPPIPLILNNTNADGSANPAGFGVTGANLGMLNGRPVGTTFDDEAVRGITDMGVTAPFIGRFRPNFGPLSTYYGMTRAAINGDWTLQIVDFRNGNAGVLTNWSINFNFGLQSSPDSFVASTTVRGVAPPGNFPNAPGAAPVRGIGPMPVIASDNTLGAFSPNAGRLYVAYVQRYTTPNNPADNTDIFMSFSDNGGLSWQPHTNEFGFIAPINDDLGELDGFSESLVGITGRAQFMPAVAVDPATGTLAVSWFDARHDASRSRVSTYVALSIDGGETFAPQTFANTPESALDAITQQTVILGPIPDNPGANNDGTFGFGNRIGLAFQSGRLYPAWAGNLNGGPDTRVVQEILVAPAITAAGPRVVAGSQGPVQQFTANGTNFNNTFTSDGVQQLNAFQITFDRDVDVRTFTAADVTLRFRDVNTPGSAPGTLVPVTDVTPVGGTPLGARQFVVTFAPQSGVGTYSYIIGPDVRDLLRNVTTIVTPLDTTVFNAPANQVNLRIPPSGTGGTGIPALDITNSTITVSGIPPAQVVTDVNVTLNLTHTFDFDLVLTLIAPDGTRVTLAQNRGGSLDNYTNTTFDDQAAQPIGAGFPPFTGSFRPETPLSSLIGRNPNGNWILEINDQLGADIGMLLSWSLTLQTGTVTTSVQTGNRMDQDADGFVGEGASLGGPGDVFAIPTPGPTAPLTGGTHFAPPYDRSTLPLIVPGPHLRELVLDVNGNVVQSGSSVPNNRPTADNLVLASVTESSTTVVAIPAGGTVVSQINVSDNYTIESAVVELDITYPNVPDLEVTLIAPDGTRFVLFQGVGVAGTANFTNTLFDDVVTTPIANGTAPFSSRFLPQQSLAGLKGRSVQGTYQLEIKNNGTATGTLNEWSIQFRKSGAVDGIDVIFDRDMDPTSFDVSDIVRIMGPIGLIDASPTYNAGNLPRPIPDAVVGGSLVSTLTINDAFTVTDLNVQLSITHSRVGDLRVELESPTGTRITLFNAIGGTGANFTSTILDDAAAALIGSGSAPFTGTFRPTQALSAFNGQSINGTWRLIVTDSTGGLTGSLISWSLTAGSVVANPNNTDPDPAHPRTFRIGFPRQTLSGSYTVVLGADIRSEAGDLLDTNLNAGLDTLRGISPTGQSIATTVNSTNVPVAIQDATVTGGAIVSKTVTSLLNVTDNFVLAGLTVQLNITHTNDPDLTAVLVSPSGTRVTLFDRVGNTGSRQNFNNTIFDDLATTPIQNGGPPFLGRFNPQLPLSTFVGENANGIWQLEITDNTPNSTGQLNSWSITFRKPVLGTGLGELVADQATVGFRIFNMDVTSPVAQQNWTPVGPASIGPGPGTGSSRIGGLAVDPSDPSGNTVYVGGASGGVWKSTNFLTNDPQGPTYIPLTDFGPTFGINIGAISVFGRNNDPNQSVVFVATGEGDIGSQGVGFLRSLDGGATWTLLDSTNNVDAAGNPLPINSPQRDHVFVGTTAFEISVDPRPTPSGEVIVYAALSGTNGGIWRSVDSGRHWQRMRAGQATDLVLDLNSGTFDAVANPTGNVQFLYGAFLGEGIFFSPNRGQVWNALPGGVGKPFLRDGNIAPMTTAIPVNNPPSNPNGPKGRIVLAKPALTGNPALDLLYQGWLYAAVSTSDSRTDGLYVTKDFGQNWTLIHLGAEPPIGGTVFIIPSNDIQNPNFNVLGDQGNYDISLVVDPLNPSIVYFGGQAETTNGGLVRVDITGLSDPHAFFLGNDNNDGGALRGNTNDPVQLDNALNPPPVFLYTPFPLNPIFNPTINMVRHPSNPFLSGTTFYADNAQRFTNTGSGSRWTPFDAAGLPDPLPDPLNPLLGNVAGVDYHEALAIVDPVSGLSRLIFGNDHGVYTVVDRGDGLIVGSLGNVESPDTRAGDVPIAAGSRNGNLQITQFYYGASQPSELAAQLSVIRGMFYGEAQDEGFPVSSADILQNGDLRWSPPGRGDGGGVATDQTGSGTLFEYQWPCCGGSDTDFFRVNGIGRTFGLIEQSQPGQIPDPQWPLAYVLNFGLNPLRGGANNAQLVIGSAGTEFGVATGGNVFSTSNGGLVWTKIGTPTSFVNANGTNPDGTVKKAFAFGAPQPNDPVGGVNNFIYVGSFAGRLFVTFTGGGNQLNAWIDISAGLDGSEVRAIATNPTRGSREAYAVTARGVYYMADSGAANATWQNITGNLFSVTHNTFGDPRLTEAQLRDLHALQADWRYVIPDSAAELMNPVNPPRLTHPVLYVGGEGGVYRSLDKGVTWSLFPSLAIEGSAQDGGYLSNVLVTDLDLSLGDIDPTNGRPDTANGPNLLLATTFGRGSFAIRLAPVVFTQSLRLDPNLPAPAGSDNGVSLTDKITSVLRPVIAGLSQQSAFGNTVRIDLIDLDDPNQPVIGTGTTDANGRFQVQVNEGVFLADGSTDGVHRIGVRATDGSGTIGQIVAFTFEIDTRPFIPTGVLVLSSTQPNPSGGVPTRTGSDSGLLTTDRITKVTQPVFVGRVDQAAPVTVQIFDDTNPAAPILLGQGTTDAAGGYVITTMAGIYQSDGSTDGVKTIRIRAFNDPARPVDLTVSQFFRLDTIAPQATTINLSPFSDSGTSATDHITRIQQPTFIGAAELGSRVRIFAQMVDANGTPIGSLIEVTPALNPNPPDAAIPSNVDSNGNFSLLSSLLAEGRYRITATQVDVAGNESGSSTVVSPLLQIITTLPAVTTIDLLPAFDTGTSNTDNITAAIPQKYVGTNHPGVMIRFSDNLRSNGTANLVIGPFDTTRTTAQQHKVNGVVVATYRQTSPTTYELEWALNDGLHDLRATATDVAGNVSPVPPPLPALPPVNLSVRVDRDALDADRKYIRALYSTELGRSGSLAEWNTWLNQLAQPDGRRIVSSRIARSREARTFVVKNWYQTYLGRQADFPAANGWVDQLLAGQTEEAVLSRILGTQEFFNRAQGLPGATGTADQRFILAMYTQLLRRNPSPSEVNGWLPFLQTNGRTAVADFFLRVREYREIVVRGYYRDLLRRPAGSPSQREVDGWVLSGQDFTSIRVNFLASPEYFNVAVNFR